MRALTNGILAAFAVLIVASSPSQASLVVLGEQGMLTDVVQIEADQVLLRLSGVLTGHSSSSLDVPGQVLLAAVPFVPAVWS